VPTPRHRDVIADETQALLARYEEFAEGFTRSARGNLTRRCDGLTLTVFARNGEYAWAIADGHEVRYSPVRYEEEGDALVSLWDELSGV
jgi:hypothetical protein